MSDFAVEVSNLGKLYRINQNSSPYGLFSESLQRLVSPRNWKLGALQPNPKEYFWALKDVNFNVLPGKVVGILGSNGSGKSTLLKILSRVSLPTTGKVIIRGRVSSMLEVQVGFHAELSGAENIYLQGTILGLKRHEIKSRFDEIVQFADLRPFLELPVKHYSSGMILRLGFAVAAHLQPDILIIDEVLAVGDALFQNKCIGRMNNVSRVEGRTVLFVSHQLDLVRQLCDYCVVLRKGEMTLFDNVEDAISHYINDIGLGDESASYATKEDPELPVQILNVRVCDEDGQTRRRFEFFDKPVLEIEYVVRKPMSDVFLELIVNSGGEPIFWSWDIDTSPERLKKREPGRYVCKIAIPSPLLKASHYTVSFNTCNRANSTVYQRLDHVVGFDIELLKSGYDLVSYAQNHGKVAVKLDWTTENGQVGVGTMASEAVAES